jgi:uncharacterized protein GlcG (DUF336 family)
LFSVLLAFLFASVASGEPLQKKSVSLEDARKAATAAAVEAKKNKWNVSIAVVDDGGHLIYFERIDEASIASVDVAIGKAHSAVVYKRPTKALEDAIAGGRIAVLALPGSMPLEGGLPIFIDGKVVGAIGVSGVKSSEDAQAAKAGVDALK